MGAEVLAQIDNGIAALKALTADMARTIEKYSAAPAAFMGSDTEAAFVVRLLGLIFDELSMPVEIVDAQLRVLYLNTYGAAELMRRAGRTFTVGVPCFESYWGRPGPCPHCEVKVAIGQGKVHNWLVEQVGRHYHLLAVPLRYNSTTAAIIIVRETRL